MTNNDIVQKLWNLCDILRDDGINYSDYVTELVPGTRRLALMNCLLHRMEGDAEQKGDSLDIFG